MTCSEPSWKKSWVRAASVNKHMNEHLKTIIDSVVTNEEIENQVRLKVLDSLVALTDNEKDLRTYLESQTKTKSKVTNELAQNALGWLQEDK